MAVGEGIGGYIGSSSAVATNFGGTIAGLNPTVVGFGTAVATTNFNGTNAASLAARSTYDSLVRGTTITAFNGKVGYMHWWTPELRSNIDINITHQDIPSVITSGRAALNKELVMSHINLLWSPVAFVTTGIEYAWGHRVVTTNAKGDSHVMQGMLRVTF